VAKPHARLPGPRDRRKPELPGMLDRALDPPAAVDGIDVAGTAAGVDRVDAEPVDRPPERGELVAAALGRARGLDRVRVADELELAVEVEPPVRRREPQVADLEARARLVARARDEPGNRLERVDDAARVVRVKAAAPVRVKLD